MNFTFQKGKKKKKKKKKTQLKSLDLESEWTFNACDEILYGKLPILKNSKKPYFWLINFFQKVPE